MPQLPWLRRVTQSLQKPLQWGESNDERPLQLLEKNGAPGESRTPDLLVRSQTLYPAELRAHRHDLTQLGAIPQLCWVQRWVQVQPRYLGSFAVFERRVPARDASTSS